MFRALSLFSYSAPHFFLAGNPYFFHFTFFFISTPQDWEDDRVSRHILTTP
jgi:hypothetical protein